MGAFSFGEPQYRFAVGTFFIAKIFPVPDLIFLQNEEIFDFSPEGGENLIFPLACGDVSGQAAKQHPDEQQGFQDINDNAYRRKKCKDDPQNP